MASPDQTLWDYQRSVDPSDSCGRCTVVQSIPESCADTPELVRHPHTGPYHILQILQQNNMNDIHNMKDISITISYKSRNI